MIRLILRRVLWSIPLLFVVTALTFILIALAPGDAARTLLGEDGTEEQYQEMRKQMGLDLPLPLQYWNWLTRALSGDLGRSAFTGESVAQLLNSRIGVTVSIMVGVVVICLVVGLTLGVLSALRGGAMGRAIDVLSMAGLVVPSFWIALVLVSVFAVQLRWFPATGYVSPLDSVGGWLASLVLPTIAVALYSITAVAKQSRDSMLEVMGRDFIRALRASGVPERSIVFRHALRNASLPTVTVLGLVLVAAIGGTVFVEKVFVLPGLGSLAVSAAQQSNIPVLQGIALYFTVLTVIINLLVDISYGWLNPKARVQ